MAGLNLGQLVLMTEDQVENKVSVQRYFDHGGHAPNRGFPEAFVISEHLQAAADAILGGVVRLEPLRHKDIWDMHFHECRISAENVQIYRGRPLPGGLQFIPKALAGTSRRQLGELNEVFGQLMGFLNENAGKFIYFEHWDGRLPEVLPPSQSMGAQSMGARARKEVRDYLTDVVGKDWLLPVVNINVGCMVKIIESICDFTNLDLPKKAKGLVDHSISLSSMTPPNLPNLSNQKDAVALSVGLEMVLCIYAKKMKELIAECNNPSKDNKMKKYANSIENAKELLEKVFIAYPNMPRSNFSRLVCKENKFDYGTAFVETYSRALINLVSRVSTLVKNAVDQDELVDIKGLNENVEIPI